MNLDIKFSKDNKMFKYRVAGILIVDNKILAVRINDNKFYCLPGGVVELMENTHDAIIREMYEETGLKVNVERLAFLTENFFNSNNLELHEIGFYYLIKPKENIEIKDYVIEENDKGKITKLEFKWLNIDNLQNIKPEFLKSELNFDENSIKHFVIKNDKIINNNGKNLKFF